jgi:hypothetical protein
MPTAKEPGRHHKLVFHANYESMRFRIDRGIDMTHPGLLVERGRSGLNAPRRERREDGSVAGGGGTAAAAPSAMSTLRGVA